MKTIGEKLIKIISICFSVFFAIILANTIFLNRTIQVNYKVLTMIIMTLFSYLIIYLIYKKIKFKFLNRAPKKYHIAIVMIIIFIIQIILSILTYADCGWDCGIVVRQAINLLKGENFDTYYFAVCSNNIGILLITKYVLKFASIFCEITLQTAFLSMIIFNIIMIDIAALFTFLVCKKILGNKSAYFSLLFILPLIIFSPYIIVPYTDTITMVFPILILYIYILIKEQKEKSLTKKILIILEGILATIGLFIKPTAIIVIIAITIVEILRMQKVEIKNLVIVGLIFIMGCGISYAGYYFMKNRNLGSLISKEDYEKYSMTFTHFLKMGMNEQIIEKELPTKNNTIYGGYSEWDALTTQTIIGKDEKQKENLQVIEKRLKEFGIAGYADFLYNKANWILSDGTFFFGEEGTFWTSEHYNQSKIGKFLQELINNKSDKYQNITANVMQVLWILITIGLVFSYTYNEQNNYILISKISIIGIVLFLLLFEGRARYLLNHLPIFIIIGVFGIKASLEKLDKAKNLLKNKEE